MIDVIFNSDQLKESGDSSPLGKLKKNLMFLLMAGTILWVGPNVIANVLGEPSFESLMMPPSWKDGIYCKASDDYTGGKRMDVADGLKEYVFDNGVCKCIPECGIANISTIIDENGKSVKDARWAEYEEGMKTSTMSVNLQSFTVYLLWAGRILVIIGLGWYVVRL